MGTVRLLVALPMVSANPKDTCVNTWHFNTTGIPDVTTHLIPILTAVKDVYTGVKGYLSNQISWSLATFKFYDLADAEPRAPIHLGVFNPTGTAGTSEAPHELALAASFEGLPVSGQKQSRRRGRIYFGPLSTNVYLGSVFTSTMLTAASTAMAGLRTASDASAAWTWIVYSRTAPDAQREVPVARGWVDNAIDIQRRRGVAATTRTVW